MSITTCKKLIAFFLFAAGFQLSLRSQEITPASPWGGKQQLREFIDQEMLYPANDLSRLTEGKVVVGCTVTRDAKPLDIRIIKSVSTGLDAEALRLFCMLLWQPASSLGYPCDGKAEVEFDFSVKHYQKVLKSRGYDYSILPYPAVDSSGRVFSFRNTEIQPKPVFRDKEMTMQQFMADNFNYPEAALRQNITGVVTLKFIVEPHGRISNLMVEKHLGAGCSEEASRLIKLFSWSPGVVGGKAVRTLMTLSLLFGLSDGTGYSMQPAQQGISLQ